MVCDLGWWWVEVSRLGGHPPLASLRAPFAPLRCAKGGEAPPMLPSTLGFLLSQK